MRIHVVRRQDIPYGGDVYVRKAKGDHQVVWIDAGTFTPEDASLMADRLNRDPALLCALLNAAA